MVWLGDRQVGSGPSGCSGDLGNRDRESGHEWEETHWTTALCSETGHARGQGWRRAGGNLGREKREGLVPEWMLGVIPKSCQT